MKTPRGIIYLSILFGLVAGGLDALVDVLFFEQESLCQDLFHPSALEIYIRTSAFVLFVVFGILSSRVVADRDRAVATSKKNEERLRELGASLVLESQRYRSIIETSIDGFWVVDDRGHFIDMNDAYCMLVGYNREELLQMTIADIEAAENLEDVASHIRNVIENGSDRFETRHRRKDGKIIDVEISTHYLTGGKGQLFVFVRDITERKKMQQEAILNDRLASLGLLVAGVAHEVANPLAIIIGYSNNLLNGELPNEVKDGLKVIDEEAVRAADILKDLLTFARHESEEKQSLNVNESIRRVLQLRSYDQRVKKIVVKTFLDPNSLWIMGNRSKLEQVFYNIIVNAEFSMFEAHQRGILTVTSERIADVVRISIEDDGKGISKENMDRIFTPFFTTKKAGEGTGLGLSVCLGIVTEHRGRLWAESTEAEGAKFIVELPIINPGESAQFLPQSAT